MTRRRAQGEVRRRKRLLLTGLGFVRKRRDAAKVTAAVTALAALTASGVAGKALADSSSLRERLLALEVASVASENMPAGIPAAGDLEALQADLEALRVRCDAATAAIAEVDVVGADEARRVMADVAGAAARLLALPPPAPVDLGPILLALGQVQASVKQLAAAAPAGAGLEVAIAATARSLDLAEANIASLVTATTALDGRLDVVEERLDATDRAILELRLRVEER